MENSRAEVHHLDTHLGVRSTQEVSQERPKERELWTQRSLGLEVTHVHMKPGGHDGHFNGGSEDRSQ